MGNKNHNQHQSKNNKIKIICPKCNGKGTLQHYMNIRNGICFRCNGTGSLFMTQKEHEQINKEQEEINEEMKRYTQKQIQQYKEDEKRKQQEEERKQKNIEKYQQQLQYYGNIGDKVKITVVLKKHKVLKNSYGTKNMYILQKENYNFIWMTNDRIGLVKDYNHIEIQAIIKEHREYNGYKQTILKNVKIMNEIDIDNMTDDEIDKLMDELDQKGE